MRQSMQAEEAKLTTNGDGFGPAGIPAWRIRPEPGVYREVTRRWSDENLLAFCAAVRCRCFSRTYVPPLGTAVARQTVIRSAIGTGCSSTNGQIGDYWRRSAAGSIAAGPLQAARKGATDSELSVLLAVNCIEQR